MKKLTQAEEQIMQALWSLEQGGYIKDVLEALEAPKPHHNTVATLLKILLITTYMGYLKKLMPREITTSPLMTTIYQFRKKS